MVIYRRFELAGIRNRCCWAPGCGGDIVVAARKVIMENVMVPSADMRKSYPREKIS